MKVRIVLAASFSAGVLLSACETPSYSAGGVIGAAGAPVRPGVLAYSADIDALLIAPHPVSRFEAADAMRPAAPQASVADHETKASAFFSGRQFLAGGKVLAQPVIETPRALINDEIPAGWRREDKRLIHAESGLECPFGFEFSAEKKKAAALSLVDVTAYDAANRDVSCNYTNGGAVVITLYASYYPDISVEDHAAEAVAAMRKTFTLKGVLPVVSVEIEDKDAGTTTADLDAPIAGGFDIGEINGAPYKASLWIAKTHGWHVKTRATYPQADVTSEIVAAVMFAANYLNVDMKNKADPTPRGPEV